MGQNGPAGRLSGPLSKGLAAVLVGVLATLVLVAACDLAGWLLLGRSWAEVEEIQGLLMIWFGLLGAVYALIHGLHLSLDLAVARLPPAARSAAERFASLAVALFGALLALNAGRLTAAVGNTLPATGWSASHQYAPGVVAGALLALVALERAIRPQIPGTAEQTPGPVGESGRRSPQVSGTPAQASGPVEETGRHSPGAAEEIK